MSIPGETPRPTDVHLPVDHPRTEEQTRAHGDRRRRCAWLVRNGHADAALDAIEGAARVAAESERR